MHLERRIEEHDIDSINRTSSQKRAVNGRQLAANGVSGNGAGRTNRLIGLEMKHSLSLGIRHLRRMGDNLATALKEAKAPLASSLQIWRLDPDPESYAEGSGSVKLLDLYDAQPDLLQMGTVSAVLGLDFSGRPVVLDFCDPETATILVTGEAGVGKSTLMRTMALSLALTNRQSHLQLVVIRPGESLDENRPVRNLFSGFDAVPHLLAPVIVDPGEAIDTLSLMADELDYRQENSITFPLLAAIIDDFDLLVKAGGSSVLDNMASLLLNGPAHGMRIVVGVTGAGDPELDDLLNHGIRLRIVGRLQPGTDRSNGELASGTEAELYLNNGEYVLVSAGNVTPFESALIEGRDLRLALEALAQPSGQVLLARPVNGRYNGLAKPNDRANSNLEDGSPPRHEAQEDDDLTDPAPAEQDMKPGANSVRPNRSKDRPAKAQKMAQDIVYSEIEDETDDEWEDVQYDPEDIDLPF